MICVYAGFDSKFVEYSKQCGDGIAKYCTSVVPNIKKHKAIRRGSVLLQHDDFQSMFIQEVYCTAWGGTDADKGRARIASQFL